ncbi:FHA domain-containing protein [Nocardioides donggukensis]|uniref:FHA domain-containing protein n=1 Tax=Nocardioides donggukensis TaxID=2774019 RepID=A0A927K615_9ACTN|nr:FHA domain-containing protein [Nocardioides donggukensis]MBD8871179.1 FHA domain-containing protein [Nocardioides donggukensis]
MSTVTIAADLCFEVRAPGRDTVHGALTGSGNRLDLAVDDPGMFAGRGDAPAVRAIAAELARRGLSLRVHDGDNHLITLGAVRASWWQRRLTGSRHIRLGSLRGAWTSARSRSRSVDTPVLPDAELAPPATLFPVAPTFMRRPRRTPTTTHDPHHGGNPRLTLVPRDGVHVDHPEVFWLEKDLTTVGSGADCDIRLPGLAERHAEIRHDEDDDELVIHAIDADTKVHGQRIASHILRTGARLDVGEWTLTFTRAEYADHGRPYGGRIGGELGHQQSQPPRDAAR